ncbi:SHOCT domain-containing protein [Pannonibacter phragmitetus]|uniref:SHOCT domain-containing protein n=1 Tax=Pannonibacter phragmitetus TaxID=121719 RepID=UPI000F453CF5|nr:SHOCT domain-containing protein [Pannonibacter phragmitetus]
MASAQEILAERLAKGEINEAEYDNILEKLGIENAQSSSSKFSEKKFSLILKLVGSVSSVFLIFLLLVIIPRPYDGFDVIILIFLVYSVYISARSPFTNFNFLFKLPAMVFYTLIMTGSLWLLFITAATFSGFDKLLLILASISATLAFGGLQAESAAKSAKEGADLAEKIRSE